MADGNDVPDTPQPAQPCVRAPALTPVECRVLLLLAANYPEKMALADLREFLGTQTAPREALLTLADKGLVRAVMLGDDRYWRATRAGTQASAGSCAKCQEGRGVEPGTHAIREPGA